MLIDESFIDAPNIRQFLLPTKHMCDLIFIILFSEIHSRSLLRIISNTPSKINAIVLIGQYKMNLLLKSDFFLEYVINE